MPQPCLQTFESVYLFFGCVLREERSQVLWGLMQDQLTGWNPAKMEIAGCSSKKVPW